MKATVDREIITAKQAREYLELNTSNRPLVAKRVNTIAAAILRGEWQENGETIKFNGDGTLLDGQHRLAAIAKAGKSVPSLVVRGLSMETQETMDTGASRTVGNMLSIRGVKNANEKASFARSLWVYSHSQQLEASRLPIERQPSPQELLAIVEDTPEMDDWINFGKTTTRADRALGVTGGTITVTAYLFAQVSSEDDAHGFWNQVVSPSSSTSGPALLRKRLLSHGSHNPITPTMQRALIIKAWNLWITGGKVTRLVWRAGGATNEPFPKIVGNLDDQDD